MKKSWKYQPGRKQPVSKWELEIITQSVGLDHTQSGHSDVGHWQKERHYICNMECLAFIPGETSPEVLLPALDPTYRENYSYTAEHQQYD